MGSRSAAERTARGRDLAIAGSALGCLGAAFVVPAATVEDGPVVCPFRLATGLPCPGCGLARSWTALAQGDPGEAFARHPFGPLLFALAVGALVAVARSVRRRARPVDLASLAGSRPALALGVVWCTWWVAGFMG
jgi:Protein of unknown function (DUF2752)